MQAAVAEIPSLHESTPCVRCGYDLRGLRIDRVCPECGTPVAHTLGGDRLSLADPRWLATITRGQGLLAIGSIAAVVLVLAMLIIAFTGGIFSPPSRSPDATVRVVSLVLRSGFVGALILASVGAFMATAREPRDTGREPMLSARRLARIAVTATVVLVIVGLGGEYLIPAGAFRVAGLAAGLAAAAAMTISVFALLTRLAGLARRTFDPTLESRIRLSVRRLRWLILIVLVLVVLTPPAVALDASGNPFVLAFCCSAFVLPFLVLLMELLRIVGLMERHWRALQLCRAAAAADDTGTCYAASPSSEEASGS